MITEGDVVMTSIRKKISTLIIGGMLSVSAAVAGMDIILTNHYAEINAQIMMNSTCEAKAQEIDNKMKLVEQAVEDILLLSEKERPPLENFSSSELVNTYIETFKNIAVEIAGNTDGAMTVYYRINPDIISSGNTGFFYVKSEITDRFEAHETTDLLAYDTEDTEHVGWYYIPVRAGKPIWMEPYYNQNIDVDMISYVIPFYEGTRLIGVVGMDIDFTDIVDTVENTDIYRSGGANILCMSNSLMYMKKNGEYTQNSIPETLYNKLLKADFSTELVDGNSGGESYKIAYQTLSNRMKLIVYAPVSDINLQRNSLILQSIIISLLILSIIMIFTIRMTDKIIEPLKKITEATKRFSEGDWQADIQCNTNDELMELTESIKIMASNTKNYIGEINDMAYKDGLTGVKNKACYMSYLDRLREKVSAGSVKFGIVVMDVNGLKSINDNRGHEAGDQLIKNASSIICRYFSHSPVFRTGGDEFVVIMESEDYDNREKIIEDFRNYMMIHKNDSPDEHTPSVASGMACFPDDSEDISEVCRLADERMYKNKTAMKGGDAPR